MRISASLISFAFCIGFAAAAAAIPAGVDDAAKSVEGMTLRLWHKFWWGDDRMKRSCSQGYWRLRRLVVY